MRPLGVFIAHSGKTVELEVGPHARVEAVQQALADLTGIPRADQILMCEGARLDSAKPLSAYGLPWEGDDRVHDVFLYSRAHLRADAPLPPPEVLPDCPVDLSGLEGIREQRHRLDAAGSPLLRALPDYQRQFQEHLLQANARHEASQQRMVTAARLVSEQEVQALSIDAATANVEVHYAYICDAFGAFMARYQQQHAAHTDVLARFEADLGYVAATELHPGLRREGFTHLVHLVSADALREAAAAAARGHQHFAGKVSELEGLFGGLKADVEALFMQAPSVDLETLTRQLEEMHVQVDEQASIVAALSSDLCKVQQLVQQAGEALAADPAASVAVSDTAAMLETMHETHLGHLLPRVTACHAAVEAFAAQCLDCKNALTRDVFTQLRTISSQQSKIREMKNKLALFREALARQEGAVQELLVVRRMPAAYKQSLAECVRRDAFMAKYAHSAAALAERMGAFRGKELSMRDAFRKHVERLIPSALLERMGLLEQPPHCQVSVSASEGECLLAVTMDDVRRIQLPWGTASLLAPAPQLAAAGTAGVPLAGGSSSRDAALQQTAAAASASEQQQQQDNAAAGGAAEDVTASLQLENAKLRAELASQIALDCIRSVQLATLGTAQAGPPLSPMGGASPGPGLAQASPPLGQSGVGSSPQAVVQASAAAALLPEVVQRFERALATKDGLVAELQAQLGSSRQQSAAYEARIQALEAQLTTLAAAADGRTSAPLLGAAVGGSSSAASSSAAGSALLHLDGSAVAATAPSSGGSSSIVNSFTASPSTQRSAVAADLSASMDAGVGSSLSGYLYAADPSRSLGPSSSLPASQHQASQQQGQQPSEPAPLQQPLEQAACAARSPAAGDELRGASVARAPTPQPAAAVSHPTPELPAEAVAAPLSGSSVHEDPQLRVPPSAAEQATSGKQLADASAVAVPVQAGAPPQSGALLPLVEDLRPQLQHPSQLLASMVADEGSDVEGIEPISDSEYASGEEVDPVPPPAPAEAQQMHEEESPSAG